MNARLRIPPETLERQPKPRAARPQIQPAVFVVCVAAMVVLSVAAVLLWGCR
jgi:hypothetical protein